MNNRPGQNILDATTYCSSVCGNQSCELRVPDGLRKLSRETGGLIKQANFKDSDKCPGFVEAV